MAVSPFDGANRIRFKGSLGFRFLIADFAIVLISRAQRAATKSKITNRKSKNHQTLSRFSAAPPKAV
jgi:hypothetical protein